MIKKLTILMAVLIVSGCAITANLAEKLTGVTCTKQVEIATAGLDVVLDTAAKAFEENAIKESQKDNIADEVEILADELLELNNQCKTEPEKAKARAIEVLKEAEAL